jgi:truncated hemoglobin YjbI
MALANPRFEDSYGRIFGSDIGMDEGADEFFYAFYDRFLRDPGIAAMFANTDRDRQVSMLKKSLFQLVTYYVVGEPNAELDRLATIHDRLGIDANAFDVWMEALVDTAAEFDEQWNEATRLAWCWALAPGIAYMRLMSGAYRRAGANNSPDTASR